MTKKIFALDRLVTAWIAISLIVAAMGLCTPLVTSVRNTPIYYAPVLLGLLGLLLLLVDLCTKRITLQAKGIWLLFLVILSCSISAIYTRHYDVLNNVFLIVWTTLFFTLFYTFPYHCATLKIKPKNIHAFLKIITLFWLIICLFSFLSFIFNVGYFTATVPGETSYSTRQGFYENRLFGLTPSIMQASIFSGILFIYSLYSYKNATKKTSRYYFFCAALVFFIHVILAGTRSTILGLFVILFLTVFYSIAKHPNSLQKSAQRIIIAILAATFTVIVAINIEFLAKSGLTLLPNTEITQRYHNNYADFIESTLPHTKAIHSDESFSENQDLEILTRKDTESISNHRFEIWKDYLQLVPSFGAFGLSPNNFHNEIQAKHSDLYIATYIKENYPLVYQEGKVYHPHNAYLVMLVSSGFVGFISICIFLFTRIKDSIKYLITSSSTHWHFYCSVSIITFMLITSLFDLGLWFDSTVSIITEGFWLILGYLQKQISDLNNSDISA